jgi:TIR domain
LPQAIRVFISHIWAEGEHDFAMELATKLTGYRDLKILIDQNDLAAGEYIKKWMPETVKMADIFLYIISPLSLQSPNCQLELREARRHRKPIIPVLLRDAMLPRALSELRYVDVRDGNEIFSRDAFV